MKEAIIGILSKFYYCSPPNEMSSLFNDKNVYSEESQLPELYLTSMSPFDKNICFYNINYTSKLKENIFPKEVLNIPNIKDIHINKKKTEVIDINKLFHGVKFIPIDVFDRDFNIDDIEQSLINSSIKKIIKENKIVPYESKGIYANQWYAIGQRGYGPLKDEEMYNFIKEINTNEKYFNLKEKLMIWERNQDIFYAVDICYENLREIIKDTVKGDINERNITDNKNFENILKLICERDLKWKYHAREMDNNVKMNSKFNIKGKDNVKQDTFNKGNSDVFPLNTQLKRRNNKYKNWVSRSLDENNYQKGYGYQQSFQKNDNYFKRRLRHFNLSYHQSENFYQEKGIKEERAENKPEVDNKIVKFVDITETIFS